MHCTRTRPDDRRHGAALVLAFALGCGDSARTSFDGDADAGAPTPPSMADDAATSPTDAGAPHFPLDGFKVTCAESPCAVGLSADSVEGRAYCALLDDGRVACWGHDADGLLGRPGPDGGRFGGIGRPELVADVSGAVAIEKTCVLLASGTVRCWGDGGGSLAFAGITKLAKGDTNRCAVVGPQEWRCMEGVGAAGVDGGPPGSQGFEAPPGAPLRRVFVGDVVVGDGLTSQPTAERVTFLLREDGTLLSSGARSFIGRDTSLFPGDPHFDEVLSGVTDIDVGGSACAISRGNVYCWGRHGDALVYPKHARPLPIHLSERAVRVSAVGFPIASAESVEASFRRLCVIGASGAVYCAGPNSAGQVGDGTRTPTLVPVRVEGLPEPAVDVVATAGSTCALVVSGRIFCWGSGASGALGNGYAMDELGPVPVRLP